MPAPIVTEAVDPTIQTAPDGATVIVYSLQGHETLMSNIGDIFRWVAEANAQLEFYRNRDGE